VKAISKNRSGALTRLGVIWRDVERQPLISPLLRQIWRQLDQASKASGQPIGTLPTNPYYYLHASDSPEARKVLDSYYSISKSDRKFLPIEAFCLAAQVSPLRVLEVIVATCIRVGATSSSVIAAVAHPRVVEKTVEVALTDYGHADRETLHKATGFLPAPKGAHTSIQIVQQNAQTQSQVAATVAAPPPEQTVRRLADRFNDARPMLPAPAPSNLPAFFEREAIPVEISGEPEDDES